ncbi:MAG TPA: hypothetical protein VGX27_14240 [Candidatus Dormibacteraeota bacterium]|nr:hypothetical protein [Candidatus Dormibacteraeota bacterium]
MTAVPSSGEPIGVVKTKPVSCQRLPATPSFKTITKGTIYGGGGITLGGSSLANGCNAFDSSALITSGYPSFDISGFLSSILLFF